MRPHLFEPSSQSSKTARDPSAGHGPRVGFGGIQSRAVMKQQSEHIFPLLRRRLRQEAAAPHLGLLRHKSSQSAFGRSPNHYIIYIRTVFRHKQPLFIYEILSAPSIAAPDRVRPNSHRSSLCPGSRTPDASDPVVRSRNHALDDVFREPERRDAMDQGTMN